MHLVSKKTFKIFYYDDVTENELLEIDSQEVTFEELTEELYHLEDDNESFIGVLIGDEKFRIVCDDYDSYKVLEFNNDENRFILTNFLDFDGLENFFANNCRDTNK